jgi:hypothetical protein
MLGTIGFVGFVNQLGNFFVGLGTELGLNDWDC